VVTDRDVGEKKEDMDGSTDMDFAPEDCHSSMGRNHTRQSGRTVNWTLIGLETWLDRLT